MNKNFENEYKEYLNAQAPDLWDRIEAGIDAGDRIQNKQETVNEPIPFTDHVQTGKGHGKSRKSTKYVRLFGSIAACFAALVLTVPVLHMLGGNKSTETAMSSDKAEPENYEITNTEEYATDDAAACDEEQTDDYAMAADTDQAETIGVQGGTIQTAGETQSVQMDDSETDEVASAAEEINKNELAVKDRGQENQKDTVNETAVNDTEVFEGVKAEINTVIKAEDGSNAYEASIIESTYENLKADTLIIILKTDKNISALEKGKTYVMKLEKIQNDGTDLSYKLVEVTE